MSLADTVKNNPTLKKLVHRMLIPKDEARPRFWVKVFLNRFFHERGKGSIVRRYTRVDVLPFNKFVLDRSAGVID